MQFGDPYVWLLALHLAVMGYYLGSDVVVNQMTFYLIASRDVTPEQMRIFEFSRYTGRPGFCQVACRLLAQAADMP